MSSAHAAGAQPAGEGAYSDQPIPNNLEAFWMPFTANRDFKARPRLFSGAKGLYYTTVDGRQVLDGSAGLWCVNAGHGREKIVEAVQKQVAEMDFAPTFNWGHPKPFELASRVTAMLPQPYEHMFFTNSGSESVDTALKIALAYHRAKGEGTRTRLIGRERGYHGVGFGGISVGGMVKNRMFFGSMLGNVDHLPHTHSLEHQQHSRGQPEWGAHLADELENIVALHDASNIAAVIVEPVAGSTGVLPPPIGYLKRLREITAKHGILLIFDEVITGFGRLGTSFATEYFDVKPDLITCAKGLTSGVIPMGGVIATKEIYDAFMHGPDYAIEFFHGYTYSGHPVAAAAGLATLDIYQEEGLFQRAAELAPYFEEAVHSFEDAKNVIDTRNIGLMGAIELAPRDGAPGKRAYEAMVKAFHKGAMIRITADTIAFSPPLIAEKKHIDELVGITREVIDSLD